MSENRDIQCYEKEHVVQGVANTNGEDTGYAEGDRPSENKESAEKEDTKILHNLDGLALFVFFFKRAHP